MTSYKVGIELLKPILDTYGDASISRDEGLYVFPPKEEVTGTKGTKPDAPLSPQQEALQKEVLEREPNLTYP